MIIHFSTSDGRYYPFFANEEKTSVADIIHLGPVGLLGRLELILGISRPSAPESARIEAYKQALKCWSEKDRNAFFAKSFSRNEIAVAQKLLQLRDELKLGGWSFATSENIPVRLKDFVGVETLFSKDVPGISDRWIMVFDAIQKTKSLPVEKIILYQKEEYLHPFFKRLFDLLREKQCNVSEFDYPDQKSNKDIDVFKKYLCGKMGRGNTFNNDNSISILSFSDNTEAALYLSRLKKCNSSFMPLLVSDKQLWQADTAMNLLDLPASGIKCSLKSPFIQQILYAVEMVLWDPLDIERLQHFLTLPYSPFRKKLGFKLAAILSDKPGTGSDQWNTCIDEFLNSIDDEKDKEKINEDIKYWFNGERYKPTDGAPAQKITDLFERIAEWARNNIFYLKDKESAETEHFGYLNSLCHEIIQIFRSQEIDSLISRLQLHTWIEGIAQNLENELICPQVGSVPYAVSTANLTGPVDHLLWWDFSGDKSSPDFRLWWQQSEKEYLSSKGVFLHSSDKKIHLWQNQMQHAILCTTERLFLFVTNNQSGKTSNTHPLMLQLKNCFPEVSDAIYNISPDSMADIPNLKKPDVSIAESSNIPQSVAYWNIGEEYGKKLKKDRSESYSGLEKLLYHPYEWVLSYQCNINKIQLYTNDDLFRMKGTFAHSVCEVFFNNYGLSLEENTINEKINSIIKDLVPKECAVFLLPEYQTTFKIYKQTLTDSLVNLRNLIRNSGFKNVEVEKSLDDINNGQIKMSGIVDMVLDNGRAVIDLKWPGASKRQNELKDQVEIQLAVYNYLVNKMESPIPYAYYILDKKMLITRNSDVFQGAYIIKVDDPKAATKTLWQKIVNTYNKRMEEFAIGKIEVGEGAEEYDETIDSMEWDDNEFLIPPTNDKKIKKISEYTNFKTFLGI